VTSSWVRLMVFGGLEVVECPSKNEIRSVPLLSYVSFWLSSLVFCLYTANLYCSSAFPGLYLFCAEIDYINNNTFAVQKKKNYKIETNLRHASCHDENIVPGC
jgi:hypothetical protein